MSTLVRTIFVIAVVVIAIVAIALGVRLVGADARLYVYEEKLQELASEHEELREQYNAAVRETAITELQVSKAGGLSVRIRTIEGVQSIIETPYDPTGEVYIDYVVRDGRVWIRRIFDAKTPPAQAMVIDPEFAAINWDDGRTRLGKAVYRSLSEGRWVVTVTGDGSLGLAKADDPGDRAVLATAPEVREYDQIEEQVDARVRDLTPGDIWRTLFGTNPRN